MSALACVFGGMDLVRPLSLVGVRSLVVTLPGKPQCFSRATYATIDPAGMVEQPEALVERLVRYSRNLSEPPVLFFDQDGYLLFLSRHRQALAAAFRFALADASLIEDLVDKERFHDLAQRLDLPVPPTRLIGPATGPMPADLGLAFPLIVKPLTRLARDTSWHEVGATAKAIRIDDRAALAAWWPRLAAAGADALAQELIPGPESRIESYHVYVDGDGGLVADFTGRELRTYPPEFGHSTAVVTTDSNDVRVLGRELVRRIGLRGVAKFDFKRDPGGRLHLLEVNPRFSFWGYPGAKAGINLPAIVFGDLTGRPRPTIPRARPGVGWCDVIKDAKAARALRVSSLEWLRWLLRCEAIAEFAWNDPMPFLRGSIWPYGRAVQRRVVRAVRRRWRTDPSESAPQ